MHSLTCVREKVPQADISSSGYVKPPLHPTQVICPSHCHLPHGEKSPVNIRHRLLGGLPALMYESRREAQPTGCLQRPFRPQYNPAHRCWKPSHVPIKRLMLTTGKPFPTHPSDPFQHRKKECSSLHSPLGLKMIELSESGKWNVVLRSHQNNIKEIDIIWLTKVLIMIMSVYMQQLYGPWARYKLCQEQPSFSFSCCQYHWNLISP